ncbi:PD-(D/E)XK nuclease family protein [Micromonospora sp. PSH03]|nr:PD-(D/E)XK nuclease family protein [Micromonospora salmantinae]
MAKAPQTPAAWFAQGSAFHDAAEMWERSLRDASERETVTLYEATYDRLIAEGLKREPDPNRWLTGGRVKGSDDITRRKAKGADQIRAFLRYAHSAPERPLSLGGDEVAVEVEFRLNLDGIEVLGYIDAVEEFPGGALLPRDYKTGTKTPVWPFQLGVYGLAIEELFGVRPVWGDYYLAKNGKPDPPINLERFNRDRVTRWFHDMDEAVTAGLFLPAPGDGCRTCGVQTFCSARGVRTNDYPPKARRNTND